MLTRYFILGTKMMRMDQLSGMMDKWSLQLGHSQNMSTFYLLLHFFIETTIQGNLSLCVLGCGCLFNVYQLYLSHRMKGDINWKNVLLYWVEVSTITLLFLCQHRVTCMLYISYSSWSVSTVRL